MGKVLSCYWSVCVNGEELDRIRKECIDSIDIVEQCDGSDTCTIVINDPDFLFIEDNIFVEEATVNVNPDNHIITTTWKTGSATIKKWQKVGKKNVQ